jgi:hypothetical protein
MREIRSYGSVGEREGNDPLYPDHNPKIFNSTSIVCLNLICIKFSSFVGEDR